MHYLFEDEEMRDLAKARWRELRPAFLTLPDFVDRCSSQLLYAVEENYSRWPMTVNDNGDAYFSYAQAVEFMKTVIERRIAIIDDCMATW